MFIKSEDKNYVRKTIIEGASSDFWKYLKLAIGDNLQFLQELFLKELEDINEKDPNEVKLTLTTYLVKKTYLEKLLNLPLDILESIDDVKETDDVDDDPYNKDEDFLVKKNSSDII